jgi:hypothetical protein
MKARSIDAVLFDFGGVFTESPFEVARRFGAALGAEPERVIDLVFGPYHEDTDHPWHRLERGEILRRARDAICRRPHRRVDAAPLPAHGRRRVRAMVERAWRLRRAGVRTAS